MNKLHLIERNVSLSELGLSSADRNTSIVLHVTATVRFNEPLNVTVNVNKNVKLVLWLVLASSTLAQLVAMPMYLRSKEKFTS